jgi:hypothetical protein
MSTRSGALQVPKVHLPKAQFAIAGALVAIAVAVTVWAGLSSSDSTPATTSSTEIVQIGGPQPGSVPRAKQLGVDVGTVVPSAGRSIIVNGEVCEICWKYK